MHSTATVQDLEAQAPTSWPSAPPRCAVRVTPIKAGDARQEFFGLLDAAEKGEAVIVERKGSRFRLTLVPPEPAATGKPRVSSPVRVEDPDVLSGNWTWAGDREGHLQFRPRRKKR